MISAQPAISVQAVAVTAAPSTAPSAAPVKDKQPAPDAQVASAYPTISAHLAISPGASISTLHILVDKVDVTSDASYAGQYVTYIPRNGLPKGTHTVSIAGNGSDGKTFQTSWSFETTTAPEPDTNGTPSLNSNAYGSGIPTPVMFNVTGNQFVGGAPISVQMTAPPGGQAFAFVCTSAWQFPLYSAPFSQFYSASIPTSTVGAAINCPVTAMYIAPDGTVTYAPYPVFVQLLPLHAPALQQHATPQPTRIPLPVRTAMPLPRATVAPLPRATAAPHPRVTIPKVRPTNAPQ